MTVRYITKNLNQTVVYWPSPQPDGYGGNSFGEPIEINGRWEDRSELFIDAEGNEVKSQAIVYVDRDIVLGGYLFLGDLAALSSAEEGDPPNATGAREIRAFRKIPNLKATAFWRKAWL